MDSHFVPVPGVGAFTAWRLPGGDSQDLGGNSDWAPGLESLVLGSRDHLAAGLLQVLHNSTLELHSEIQQNIKGLETRVEHSATQSVTNPTRYTEYCDVLSRVYVPDSHGLFEFGLDLLFLLVVHI